MFFSKQHKDNKKHLNFNRPANRHNLNLNKAFVKAEM
jgi:hypothetical protein